MIRHESGRVVWDNDRWSFLDTDDVPGTANPSLWRQARLNAEQGLFEVCPGIYQIRGLDAANMTVVEGDTGVVILDPVTTVETAAAAWELYRRNRDDRPVHAVLYSHSHGDHFGGVHAVTTVEDVEAGRCRIYAPAAFMHHAVSENIIAGPAMRMRSSYQYGSLLSAAADDGLGGGLAQAWPGGTVGLIAPTDEIGETGQEVVVDGVRMVFQLAPNTEAPSEMNFYFPDHKVLLVAENACHTLHNVQTLRGALVRDAHAWAGYLTETIQMFCGEADILIGSHSWPTWGRAELTEMLGEQRDAYAYLHDQAVRLMNRGLTGVGIAEEITEFPGELGRAWHIRGYYGSISHNLKGIYNRYMGWYDGNPAHLWQLPPADAGHRYLDALGGADAVVTLAREAFAREDFRWVAELLNHVIFAEPTHADARELQAQTFERIGWAQENGTWRNCFLSGAHELRGTGAFADGRGGDSGANLLSPSMLSAVSNEEIFDVLSVRLDGPRAAAHRAVLRFEIGDPTDLWTVLLRNGVLVPIHGEAVGAGTPDVTVRLPRSVFTRVMAGLTTVTAAAESGQVTLVGDAALVKTLDGLFEMPQRTFPLATP